MRIIVPGSPATATISSDSAMQIFGTIESFELNVDGKLSYVLIDRVFTYRLAADRVYATTDTKYGEWTPSE